MNLQPRSGIVRHRFVLQVHKRQRDRRDLDRVVACSESLFKLDEVRLAGGCVKVAKMPSGIAANDKVAQQNRHRQGRLRVMCRSCDAETIATRCRCFELSQIGCRIATIAIEDYSILPLPNARNEPFWKGIVEVEFLSRALQFVNRCHSRIEDRIGCIEVPLDQHRRNIECSSYIVKAPRDSILWQHFLYGHVDVEEVSHRVLILNSIEPPQYCSTLLVMLRCGCI